MKLAEIREILNAEVLVGEEMLHQVEVLSVCGADLMSDVLAFTKDKTLLLTGLVNTQVVRTAEMIDLIGLVFVRGKRPTEEIIQMAREQNLPVMATEKPLYETCGILFTAGLPGCSSRDKG